MAQLPPGAREFLKQGALAHIVTLEPDGSPHVSLAWAGADGDEIVWSTFFDQHKLDNLRRDPRVSVVAEAGGKTDAIRGVAVHGRAEFLQDGPERRKLVDRFMEKYHPRLEKLWGGRTMPANRVMFRIVPAKVRSWGL